MNARRLGRFKQVPWPLLLCRFYLGVNGCVRRTSGAPWPLARRQPPRLSAMDPGGLSVQMIAKVEGSIVDRQLVCGRPEVQLIAKLSTLAAIKPARLEVDR